MVLIPREGEGQWALIGVMSVMCFLACLTLGGALMLQRVTAAWASGLAGEATVQILPAEGGGDEGRVAAALALLEQTPGVIDAHALSDDDNRELLRPWLGDANLAEIPLPRLIAVTFDPMAPPDLGALSKRLEAAVPGASFDDHSRWNDDLASLSGTIAIGAYAVLALIALAAAATVMFAARAGLESHRDIVEVLHSIGARSAFIAREFERRFLAIGLRAGLAGAVAAALCFYAAAAYAALSGEGRFYLPSFGLELVDYPWLLAVPLFAALISMFTARATVLGVVGRMP